MTSLPTADSDSTGGAENQRFSRASPTLLGCVFVRSGSTRLPGKCYKPVGGRPSLDVLLQRLLRSSAISELVVCTTTLEGDELVAEIARRNGVPTYRGSENIHDRAMGCAETLDQHPDYLARLTADNVLIDPMILDQAFAFMVTEGSDYLKARDVVDGCDFEIIRFKVLAEMPDLYENYLDNLDFMTRFLDNAELLGVSSWRCDLEGRFDFGRYRLTLDYPEDLEVLDEAVAHLGPQVGYPEICRYLQSRPEFANTKYVSQSVPKHPIPRLRVSPEVSR